MTHLKTPNTTVLRSLSLQFEGCFTLEHVKDAEALLPGSVHQVLENPYLRGFRPHRQIHDKEGIIVFLRIQGFAIQQERDSRRPLDAHQNTLGGLYMEPKESKVGD